jgi:phage tail protein X
MDYEIQQGDTLSQIVAEHYGLTKWADIQRVYETVARNNGIEDPDKIYTGNNLVLFDDPTVDLHPEGTEVCSDLNAAFCRAVDGTTLAANSPDAPVVRPQLRPEGLAPAA